MNILSYEMTCKSRTELLCTSTSCNLLKSKFYIKRNKVQKKTSKPSERTEPITKLKGNK